MKPDEPKPNLTPSDASQFNSLENRIADLVSTVSGGEEPQPEKDQWQVKLSHVSPEAMDPLLGCLVALTKHFGDPKTATALTANLPLDDGYLTPDLFLRSAERVGLSARITSRPLERIPEAVLPAVLLLRDRSACILMSKTTDGKATVMLPESGEGEEEISLEELRDIYDGYTIFARPQHKFHRQAEIDKKAGAVSWFWGTLASFWPTYSQVILAAIVINSFALASPLFVMNVYDRVVPNQAVETLWVLASGIGIVITFDLLLRVLRAYFVDSTGKRVDVLLSSRIFEQLLNIQTKARPESAGAFANKLREFESLREFFTSATLLALVDLPFVVFFLLVIWFIGGPVVIVPAVAIPIILFVGLFVHIPLKRAIRRNTEESDQKQGIVVETINALDTIKAMGIEGRIQKEWERFVGSSAETGLRARFVSGLGVHFSTAAMQLVTVATVVYGVQLITAGNLTVGGLIACTILTGRAMAPLGQVAGLLSRVHQSSAALKGLNEVMSLPVEKNPTRRYLSRADLKGNIEFQDVTFNYPGSEIAALKNANFKIEAGERVGIIGPVGSGKTTITKLLTGLYEPTEGSILLDGTDIRQIDPADVRRAIGVVQQDIVLFHGTVWENIAMASPYADDATILDAARMAGVDDFVKANPLGYDIVVGEKGQFLSGGQRQLIALARALVSDPKTMLLDEPTSMMDMNSERRFCQKVSSLLPGKTMLLVTHRPSLFSLVNRIIVLGQGKVVADGPRDNILAHANRSGKDRRTKPRGGAENG
ncbi:MAG: type I secretion system permease/ATPase [Rhodospirillales bacterium]|nr:type I secretion system permease/ATPase [Rhodospirillales bacterium]